MYSDSWTLCGGHIKWIALQMKIMPRYRCSTQGSGAQVPVGLMHFCYDWSGVLNWCCPPVCLICRLLKHARACGAQGTLIVPHWPSAVFWPIICPQAGRFASFIKSVFELPQVEGITLPGKRGHNLVDGKPKFKLLALRFCF